MVSVWYFLCKYYFSAGLDDFWYQVFDDFVKIVRFSSESIIMIAFLLIRMIVRESLRLLNRCRAVRIRLLSTNQNLERKSMCSREKWNWESVKPENSGTVSFPRSHDRHILVQFCKMRRKSFCLSKFQNFWGKITKMITRMNSRIFTNSIYIWI